VATYSQFLKHPKFTRVAWLCGTEPVLARAVQEAYARALPALRPLPMWSDGRLWDDLLTVPLSPQLVVVRDAEKLRDLSLLPQLLADEFDGCYTVFTSTEDDFRRDDKKLIEPLAALRDSRHGQLVRCCAPVSDEDAADIVAAWWPGAGRNIAAALLARCGGSLTAAYQAADKAVRAGLAPDTAAIPAVCQQPVHGHYADMLLAGRRREAMDAARFISEAEVGGVLALLASRVALLPLVRDAAQRRESPQDTVRRLRADAWVLRQLRPYAADYDPDRVARCREVLAVAETAWKSGSRTGVLEAVAALW
jgi:hypothetical protein